ncbi:hypothetical protein SAMN05428966_101228 [Massilia sp. PDC64]|nr:hypothetical protein [Massilia sp. PDC64]SDC17454.1 hypothetical protein SAMN05428966_101228 [Massilia sp. PDC64]
MRHFFRAHWKAIVAIVLLVLLALVTVNPGAAVPEPPLAMRLRAHVTALAAGTQDATARRAEAAAYIASVLRAAGYTVQDRAGTDHTYRIEAVLANVAPDAKAARTFIVGARYDGAPGADPETVGTAAAVLELARLLSNVRPSSGTEIRFAFFLAPDTPAAPPEAASLDDLARVLAEAPDERPGSFIAYVGSLASSRQVQDALSAFQSVAAGPAHGLATPAYMQGVTLSDRAAWRHPGTGLPALVLTDTSFTRFPYRQAESAAQDADDPPEQVVFAGMARVVSGLARTLTALAAGQRG